MSIEREDLRRLAGQILVGGFDGLEVDRDFAELAVKGVVGGAILFRRNIASLTQVAELVGRLTALSTGHPLILAVDQEGGRVQRLPPPFPQFPPMRSFGESGRKTLIHRAGVLLGKSLRMVGFHQDYAPVLDVDSNPNNPVIGDRSFSSDASAVARMGAAFIDGIQSEGVAACGKHFPGHGDTSEDSHLELPRLDHDRDRLNAIELFPFRAAVRAGVAAIMTAHILFPALDPQHPATLSERIVGPLLREELGYDGVVVSDDLEMKAIADHYAIEEAVVRAVKAGCDQVLICHRVDLLERAHRALVLAVEGGELEERRLVEAATRVLRLKRQFVGGVGVDVSTPLELEARLPTLEVESLLAELETGAASRGRQPDA